MHQVRKNMDTKIRFEDLKERSLLENLGFDWRIIIKWILKN